MEYKDIKELIQSAPLNNIKEKFIEVKGMYQGKDGIKNNAMQTAGKALCKFYNGQKTTVFAIKDSENSYDKKEYKINKKNIGKTAYYRKNVSPFEDIQSFFEVLKLDYFQKGLKKVMKPEGKTIVDFLIMLNNKYPLPQTKHGKKNRAIIEFNTCEEEREAFGLNETSYITIDEDGIYIDNGKNGDSWTATNLLDNYEETNKQNLKGIEENESISLLRMIFISKHEQEINQLVDKYKTKLEKDYKMWEDFKEEFNGRLAKYVLLDNLCGRK